MQRSLPAGPRVRAHARRTVLLLFVTAAFAACQSSRPEPSGQTEAPEDVAADSSPNPTLARIWNEGVAYGDFLAEVRRRSETWHLNTEQAHIDPMHLERAGALQGTWRLLMVAVDACMDSSHTLPYLAALADQVDAIELRVVEPSVGRELQNRYRSPDGRAATPVLVMLDERDGLAGCWVEQPDRLGDWWLTRALDEEAPARTARKIAWYEEDRGWSTVDDVLGRLEAAASGRPVCGTTPEPSDLPPAGPPSSN